MRPVILFAIYSVAFAGVTLVRGTAGANDPAHELAQKFAIGDQELTAAQPQTSKPELTKSQLSNPQPIQAQPARPQPKTQAAVPAPAAAAPKPKAQAQAQVQTEAQTQTQAQTPAAPKAAAAPPAVAPTAAAPTVTAPTVAAPTVAAPIVTTAPKAPAAKPRPPAPGPDYERDMLDAARAEADARQQPQTKQAESAPPPAAAPATAAQPSAPAPTAAPAQPAAQAATPPPAPAPATPAAAPPQIKIEAKVNVPAPAAAAIVSRPEGAPLATILAVLTHHAHDSKRAITPPDPIICLADICYISSGPNADAKLISRSEALSTKNTVTSGAGACKGMNRCAYRGVAMKRGDEVQIIDLGLVGHDKREPADVTPDTSCRVEDGDLTCDQPVAAPDYRIWVVPETVATAAGPGAIEHALADDLPEEDIERTEDK